MKNTTGFGCTISLPRCCRPVCRKTLSGWALALSERSTGESAWLILGLTGAAFATGLSELWVAFGCVAGIVVAWLLLARKFRAEADRYGVLQRGLHEFLDWVQLQFIGLAAAVADAFWRTKEDAA